MFCFSAKLAKNCVQFGLDGAQFDLEMEYIYLRRDFTMFNSVVPYAFVYPS